MPSLQELLVASSRTFAVGIRILPEPLRTEVTVAYLLLRVSDYLEDNRELGGDEKVALLRKWQDVLAGDAARQTHGKSMMSYLIMMAVRLIEMRRILKATGSVYLHCDSTASHYLKLLMDAVLGRRNFRNHIIWKRTSVHNSAKRWGPNLDSILFYTKGDQFTWNKVRQPYDPEYIDKFYRYQDEKGQYRVGDLTGAGLRHGNSGRAWRGIAPSKKGRHWAVPMKILTKAYPDRDLSALSTQEKLELLDEAGLVHWPKRGTGP